MKEEVGIIAHKSAMERESVVARDFLGLNRARDDLGGDSQAQTDSQRDGPNKAHFKDKVSLASMSFQWPYSNKAAALQQFISFKNLQEGSKKTSFDQLSNSGFHPISTADAFDVNNRSTSGSQKTFKLDPAARNTTESGNYHFGQNGSVSRPFSVSRIMYPAQAVDDQAAQGYNNQEGRMFPCSNYSLSVSNSSIPAAYFNGHQATATTSLTAKQFQGMPLTGQHSFLPVRGSASTSIPGCVPSIPEKPAGAQLTIFYAGSVNVYDDIAADKAQAIMFLAGNGSSSSGKTASPPPQSSTISMSLPTIGHVKQATSVGPSQLNVLSATNPQANSQKSETTVQSQTSHSTAIFPGIGDLDANQSNVTSNNQQETPKLNAPGSTSTSIMSRAVPQARKASLARFLEKRKERVITKAPYPTKKSPEDGDSAHSDKSLSPKCSSTPIMDVCKSQHEFIPKPEEKGSWQ